MNSRLGAVHPEIAICIWSLAVCPASGMLWQHGKGDTSTKPPLWTHPTSSHIPALTLRPPVQKYPNTRPRLALFCLWELHTTNCLILLHVLCLLSCSGGFAEAVVSQMCTLQNRGISTLSSERQSPFSKSLGHRGHVHRARASRRN